MVKKNNNGDVNKVADEKNNTKILTTIIATIAIILGSYSIKLNNIYIGYIAISIPFIYSLFISPKKNFKILCILLASNRVLTAGSISVLLLIMIGFLLSVGKKIKIPKEFAVLSLIFILINIISSRMNINYIFLGLKVIVMLLYFYNMFININVKDIPVNSINDITLGIFISFFASLIINRNILKDNSRFSLTNGGGENVLAILCAIIIIYTTCNLLKRSIKQYKVINLVILFIIGIFTGSRSFILALAVGGIYIFLYELSKANIISFIKTVSLACLILVLCLILIYNVNFINEYYNLLLCRTNKLNSVDVSNGRFELWKQYIDVFKSNSKVLWFGEYNYEQYGINFVAHNMIMEQIATYGIVGSIIVAFMYIVILRKPLKKYKFTFNLYFSMLLSFFVVSLFSHLWLGIFQTTLLFICLIPCYKERNLEKEEN